MIKFIFVYNNYYFVIHFQAVNNIPSIEIQHVESDSDVESPPIDKDDAVSELSESPSYMLKVIVVG